MQSCTKIEGIYVESSTSYMYKGLDIYGIKGSLCFVLKFALPLLSFPLPSEVQISK